MRNIQDMRKRSVDNLQRLYTFIIGLAVTELLKRVLLDNQRHLIQPSRTDVMMVVSFLATLIPFYHGTNRYLDSVYVYEERTARRGALMFDFFVIFLVGLGLFMLAMSVGNARQFYFILLCILEIDVLWVWSTSFTSVPKPNVETGHDSWFRLNVIFGGLIFLVGFSPLNRWIPEIPRQFVMMCLVVIRTVFDYKLAWKYYYPEESSTTIAVVRAETTSLNEPSSEVTQKED